MDRVISWSKGGTEVETLSSTFTHAHRHSDDFRGHFIHYTKLPSFQTILRCMFALQNISSFIKVGRDTITDYLSKRRNVFAASPWKRKRHARTEAVMKNDERNVQSLLRSLRTIYGSLGEDPRW